VAGIAFENWDGVGTVGRPWPLWKEDGMMLRVWGKVGLAREKGEVDDYRKTA